MNVKKSVSAAERKKDYHAGPGNSFPIGPAGEHLRAAWDLAGHAANPDEVRRKILAFAREHGLMDHLPESAKEHMAKKAKNGDLEQLFHMAWMHETMEGDAPEKRRLVQFAHDHQLTHLLPDDAHNLMHDMSIPHNHEDTPNDENGMHRHVVTKSFNPIAIEGVIVKSWFIDQDAFIEGWLSTPRKDLEKDVTEPEAFIPGMDSYFARRAPLSLEHDKVKLPIGHLQKAAVVRDGKVLKSAAHPVDAADFEHFPGSGSGVWIRARINEPPGVEAIRKGSVGGFSFIANAPKLERLAGGRYRYLELNPWMESTVAAYPINPDAVIAVAKAFGLPEDTKEDQTMPKSLEEIMQEAANALEAQKQAEAQEMITKADLGNILTEFKNALLGEVAEEVKKAIPSPELTRGEGTGRKGTVQNEDPRDANPVDYVIQKARKGEEWDDVDKAIVGETTLAALLFGLRD